MKKQFLSVPSAIGVLSLFWLLLISIGLYQVWRYSNSPGKAASAPLRWPENEGLDHVHDGAALIMVVHPHCPCSRASLAELAQLMARSQGRLDATVAFVQYPGVSEKWVETDTWRQAAAIPGVHVVRDSDGVLAHRFGAYTSGQTYLYDKRGRLLFSGGLTDARGHEGNNAGLSATLALMRGQVSSQTRTSVFGCPLFPQAPLEEKEHSGGP